MSTEEASPRSRGFDLWPTSDAVEAMLEGQLVAAAAVKSQIEPLARAATEAARVLHDPESRLVYVGAGTSGRLAVLDGTELQPTFGWRPERTLYVIAGGMNALTTSVENAEDDEDSARELVRSSELGAQDVVIGLSASGTTPFTIAALSDAGSRGALTIGLANNAGAPLLARARHPIFLDTGAELLSGSTRMKAGTAQKIALNLLSTAIMLRLGHIYDGFMVDMRLSNRKLRARATRMVADIAGVSLDEAAGALEHAQGSIKAAVLVSRGMACDEAMKLLAASGNNLRTALSALP